MCDTCVTFKLWVICTIVAINFKAEELLLVMCLLLVYIAISMKQILAHKILLCYIPSLSLPAIVEDMYS